MSVPVRSRASPRAALRLVLPWDFLAFATPHQAIGAHGLAPMQFE